MCLDLYNILLNLCLDSREMRIILHVELHM